MKNLRLLLRPAGSVILVRSLEILVHGHIQPVALLVGDDNDEPQIFRWGNRQPTIEVLKGMGIPDHLICLLRNLCAGQE